MMTTSQERMSAGGRSQRAAVAGLLGLAILSASAGCRVETSTTSDSAAPSAEQAPPACSALSGESSYTVRVALGVSPATTRMLLGEAGPEQQATAWDETAARVGRALVEYSSELRNPAVAFRVGYDDEAPFDASDAEAATDLLTAQLGEETGMPVVDESAYSRAQDQIASIYIGSFNEATQAFDCSRL